MAARTSEGDVRPPRFSSAATLTYATQLGVALLSFASVLIVARALGPEGRGEVALLTTIAVLTSNLGLLGIDEANVNLAGADPRLRRALATNSLILSALFGAFCVAVLVAAIEAVPALAAGTEPALRWVAYATIPVLILKVCLKFLAGADFAFRITNTAWLLPPLASFVVNGALAALGELTVEWAFVTWAFAHAAATLLLVAWVGRRSVGFGRPSADVARRTLSFGVRSHPGRVMMAGNYRVDQWFVGAVAGTRELGTYSVAVALSEVLFYLPTALVIAQRPYLVRASAAAAARRAAQVFRATVLLTGGLALAVFLVAPSLCTIVFGDRFAGSTDDLRVLAFGAFGIVALKLLGNALTAQRRPTLATAGAAVAFVVTIALDIALIPRFGGVGAAIASTVAYNAGGVAIVAIFLSVFRVSPAALAPRLRELPDLLREVVSAPLRVRETRS